MSSHQGAQVGILGVVQGYLQTKIYAIRISVNQFFSRYNGFLPVFFRFLKNFENRFSPERALR
jgi:hypothetical protein